MNIDWQVVQTTSVVVTTAVVVIRAIKLLIEIKQHFFGKMTKKDFLINFLSSESISVREFFINTQKEIYPKWIGVSIIIAFIVGFVISPATLYCYLKELSYALAFSPILGVIFVLIAFLIVVAIFTIIQKWPRPKLFHISKLLSAFIWGNIALLVLLVSEINYPAIPLHWSKIWRDY